MQYINNKKSWDFPYGPVVNNLLLAVQGTWI